MCKISDKNKPNLSGVPRKFHFLKQITWFLLKNNSLPRTKQGILHCRTSVVK